MDKVDNTARIDLDEEKLWDTVEQLLRAALRRPVRISSLVSKPNPLATLFPAHTLFITLQSGENISLFMKHLGPEQKYHPDKQCRDREIRIYEDLLTDDDLPVVRFYGSRWNERTQRREVFLEYIDDWCLKYHELDYWFVAARRLAYLHAYFANRVEKLLACDHLLRLDATYFCEWAGRALAVVAERSASVAIELEHIVCNYECVAATLTQQPLTLVHNDLSPKNVIADSSYTPARICFVDWELAGVGCGLLDLVHLKYGLDPINDDKMCTAYCTALADTALLPASTQDVRRLFAACEIHNIVYRLAHTQTLQTPIERMAQWVDAARQELSHV